VTADALEPHALPPPAASSIPKMALVLLAALKVGVLLVFGPTMQPDTAHYVGYADAILDGTFRHVDLTGTAIPITLMRVIGLPAIIAVAKLVAGNYWAWAIVLLQFAVSLFATALVFRWAGAFRLGMWLSLGVAAAYATSLQFPTDQAVLSDSLCGSAATITTCQLAMIVLRPSPSPLPGYFYSGLALAAAFLMRDVIVYLAIGLIPLAVAAAAVERTMPRRALAAFLVFAPLTATYFAYTQWNRERVGAPIITSISGTTLLGALAETSAYDPTIFSGSSPIDIVGRQLTPTARIGSGSEYESSDLLHRDFGWNAIQISQEVTKFYLRTWVRHPRAMIHRVLSNLSEQQLHQAVRPTETIRDVLLWNTGSDHQFARISEVRSGNLWMIPAVIVHEILETISVAVFLAFLLLSPMRLIREGLAAEAMVAASILFLYLTVDGLYAAVSFTLRYLLPVVAGSIVVGTSNLVWLIKECRGRIAAGRSQNAVRPT
jgi:hypothetical protein